MPAVVCSCGDAGSKLPQRVSFVETLTKILCDNIPDFWRLGQSYLSGKLLKEVGSETVVNLPVLFLQLLLLNCDCLTLSIAFGLLQ